MEEIKETVKYECVICFDVASEPVVTRCGHLFWYKIISWACIYQWLQINRQTFTCPVCSSGISADSLIPVFIRENNIQRTQDLPLRPVPQRQDPVPNSRFNPV